MRKLAIVFLLIAAPVFTQELCHAQQTDAKKKTVNPAREGSLLATGTSSIDSLLKEEQKRSNEWGVTLSASFTDEEAEGKSTSKLNTSAEITKGKYPRQLRFKEKSDILLEDKKLEEDVTTLILNYDYYVKPAVEIYAFLERFKDSYMGIKHRYEVGFGALFESTVLGRVKEKGKKGEKTEELFGLLSTKHKDSLSREEKVALNSIKKRNSRLTLSLAFTFFREIEQPDEIVAKVGMIDSTVSLESETRFRVVVRPWIMYRATEELKLSGFCYFKFPAFHPQKVDNKYDYRIDAQFSANLTLDKDNQGNGKVDLNFGYDLRYDKAPPSVELNGERTEANGFHGTTTLGITVGI